MLYLQVLHLDTNCLNFKQNNLYRDSAKANHYHMKKIVHSFNYHAQTWTWLTNPTWEFNLQILVLNFFESKFSGCTCVLGYQSIEQVKIRLLKNLEYCSTFRKRFCGQQRNIEIEKVLDTSVLQVLSCETICSFVSAIFDTFFFPFTGLITHARDFIKR